MAGIMHKSSSVSQQVSCPNYILIANVGIGTTAPEQALDVNGYIRTEHSAFSAKGAGIVVPAGGNVSYDIVTYNVGDCFNATTGVFTCAVMGIYVFSATVSTGVGDIALFNITTDTVLQNTGGSSITTTVLCNLGDMIAVRCTTGPSVGGCFNGCLLFCTGFRPTLRSTASTAWSSSAGD